MPLLTRVKQLAGSVESSSGTAETLVSGDVFAEFEELTPQFKPQMQERNPLRPTLSPQLPVMGIRQGEITGRLELVAGGDTTTPPACDLILKACGFQRFVINTADVTSVSGTFEAGEQLTVSAKEGRFIGLSGSTLVYAEIAGAGFADTETVTGTNSGASLDLDSTPAAAGFAYMPITETSAAPLDTYTFQVICDGIRKKIFGALGTCRINAAGPGQIAYLEFTLSGAMTKPDDLAILTGTSPLVVTPETFLAAALAAGDDSLCVNSLQLDMQNEVSPRPCANATSGISNFRITGRNPIINIDPEAALEATVPFYTQLDAVTAFPFTATIGQSASKRCRIVAPQAAYRELTPGDREGTMTYDAQLQLSQDLTAGDDEVLIAFW